MDCFENRDGKCHIEVVTLTACDSVCIEKFGKCDVRKTAFVFTTSPSNIVTRSTPMGRFVSHQIGAI